MSTANVLIFTVVFLLLPSFFGTSASGNEYVGAAACKSCHQKEYDDWKVTGHALVMRKPAAVDTAAIPLPAGYGKKDISYLIGGYRWKALFLDKNGYLITSTPNGKGRNQYNIKSNRWVDYLPGQKVPYDCGRCHTTGFSPKGHQDRLAGIIGTWKFDAVECEACHGPGSVHAKSGNKTDIKAEKNICAKCHSMDPLNVIPAEGAFVLPYTEVNQLMKSKMSALSCVDCHNPHRSSENSIKRNCKDCHEKVGAEYEGSYMYKVGVKCEDCHMAPAGMVAEGDKVIFKGDLKSHIFKIDHRRQLPVLTVDGKAINPGYLSVDYVCTRCHSLFESRQWAVSFAMYSHRIKVTSNIKMMRLQTALASLGTLFSLIALLSAVSLKNWLLPAKNKKRMVSIHKHSAWITFSLYVFISILCIYFHFPMDRPAKAFDMGWFMIHVFNGPLGLIIYAGKVVAVRIYKKGWGEQGVLWGTVLFVFWLIQYTTAILSFLNILKV